MSALAKSVSTVSTKNDQIESDLKRANDQLDEIPKLKENVVSMKKIIKNLEEAQGYTDADIADLKSNLT